MGKPHYYQKVIICLAVTSALSLSMATQFLRCQKAFLLTTAAQNMHDLRHCPCEASATFSVPIILRNSYKAPPKSLGHLRLREPRRQPF